MAGPWSKKKKRIVAGIGILLVASLIVVGLLKENTKKKPGLKDKLTTLDRGPVVEQLRETGRIEFVRTVEVKSTISGEVIELFAEPGSHVRIDQPLARIKPDPNQTLQLHNVRAGLERARIDLQQTQKELERKEALRARNLVSEEEVDRLRDQNKKAQSAYRLAVLELETLEARSNIDRSDAAALTDGQDIEVRILSPAAGIVIARPVEIGEVVVSGISTTIAGSRLYEIGDPSEMIVRADISEVDIGRMKQGQHVDIIVDAFPDTTYSGMVHRISPVGQIRQGSSVVVFDTEILIVNPDSRLRQGMSCDIDIVFARADSASFLPVEAVYEHFGEDARMGDKKGRRGAFLAYVAQEDSLIKRELDVGLRSEARIEILSGVTAGDSVAADAKKVFDRKRREAKKARAESEDSGTKEEKESEQAN